jgi:hypothetical protein
VNIEEEYEQRYDARLAEPIQLWIFCRLCRCRLQIRTLARPNLPFRCYCGYAGTLSKFDAFEDEDAARRFATTFEDVYQTTKQLMKDAQLPVQNTQIYKPDVMARIKAGLPTQHDQPPSSLEASTEEEAPELDPNEFRQTARDMTEAVTRARGVLERHEALSKVAVYAFPRRGMLPEARRLCYQACESDVHLATAVVHEATSRFKGGERVKLKFQAFKRLIILCVEDGELERALHVALRGQQLGLPGYEDKVEKLRAQIARR